MKRIVRLTESDLTRIVRRVLNEGNGAAVATSFIKSLSQIIDDEDAAWRNVALLKDAGSVTEFTTTVKSKTGKDFCTYLNSEMSDVYDAYGKIVNHVKNLGGPNCFQYSYAGHLKKSVKRGLGEGVGEDAYDKIWWAMAGPGTNNGNVKKGVFMIQSKADYNELLSLVKRKQGKNTVMAWIATDMDYAGSSGYDKSQSAATYWPGQREQNEILSQMSAHLRKFNSAETIV